MPSATILRSGIASKSPEQAEVHLAVVAHDRDAERLALGQRGHREEVEQLAPEQVERHLRARDVRYDEVEEALARLQPRGLRHHGRAARSRSAA